MFEENIITAPNRPLPNPTTTPPDYSSPVPAAGLRTKDNRNTWNTKQHSNSKIAYHILLSFVCLQQLQERPISTIQFGDPRLPTISSTFAPRTGLDILYGIPSVHIELNLDLFTCECSRLLALVYTRIGCVLFWLFCLSAKRSAENKFTVRSATADALYAARESSTLRDRWIWGSKRPFTISLLDKCHTEAILLRRPFRLGVYALQPQCIEVWTPPGDFIGYVRETVSIYTVQFEIEDRRGQIVGRIQGPPKVLCSCGMTELYLRVLSEDCGQQLGTITRIWNTDISTFTQNVYFADPCMAVQMKALLVGVAFLTVGFELIAFWEYLFLIWFFVLHRSTGIHVFPVWLLIEKVILFMKIEE